MAERNPTFTPDAAADRIDYQPLSLLAVAGLAVAVLFAAGVFVSAVIALVKGEPVFLPGWIYVPAVAGAVLSAAGLWEINTSEGTRAGVKVAKWGLWLSVVVALGYFTYQFFTGLAIIHQADRFITVQDVDSGFFPRLQSVSEIDVETAFLFTLNWAERANAKPGSPRTMAMFDQPGEAYPRGRLSQFLDSHLVRILRQSPPSTVKIETLGVTNWGYENRSYKIVRAYRITTEDGVFEVPLLVSSQEAEGEGEKRKWKVEFDQTHVLPPTSRTEQGYKKRALREKSFDFLRDKRYGFFDKLSKRQSVPAWLAWQPADQRQQLMDRAVALDSRTPLAMVAGSALMVDYGQREALLEAFLPGYKPLAKAVDYFQNLDGFRSIFTPLYRTKVRDAAVEALSAERLGAHPFGNLTFDELADFEVKGGEVRISHPFDLGLVLVDPKEGAFGVILQGRAVVAASDKLDPASPTADQEWRIVRIEFTRASPIPEKKQKQ